MFKEFRDFVLRGNVLDLAVAVVIGAAFTGIVNSLVADIIMPLIGILTGGIDFTSLTVQVGDAVIAYGKFIQAVINFLLIALVIFFMVRIANRMTRAAVPPKPVEPPPPPEEILLLREIRDSLKPRQ